MSATAPPAPHDAAFLRASVTLNHRQALLSVLAIGVVFGAPLVVRWCFGVFTTSFVLSTLLAFAPVTLVSVAVMEALFRATLRRGLSLRNAGLVSVLGAVPVIITGYLLIAVVARRWPSLSMYDPGEPLTPFYLTVTGLFDSISLLVSWVAFIKLPALIRLHEARTEQVAALHREAELLRLKAHLEPHFLLNTMNAIAGLVTEDPSQAREMLVTLGDLLRDATSLPERHSVADEIAWLERYIAIHQARFPSQFEVDWQVERDVRSVCVPSLLLQPLVENAIAHGASRADTGRLQIRIAREAGRLALEVRDNGAGPGPRRPGGKGLSIVERRLQLEASDLGAPASFSLEREGDWTCARVLLPTWGAPC